MVRVRYAYDGWWLDCRRFVLVVNNDGQSIMGKRRVHPIHVIQWLGIALGLACWGLGIAGFVTGNTDLYRWAAYTFGVLLCVAFTPLLVFVLTSFFERK